MKDSTKKALRLAVLLMTSGELTTSIVEHEEKLRSILRAIDPEKITEGEILEQILSVAFQVRARCWGDRYGRTIVEILRELRWEDLAVEDLAAFRMSEQEAREAFETIAFNRLFRRCECEDDVGFVCRRCRHYGKKDRPDGGAFDLAEWFERVAHRWAGFAMRARRVDEGPRSKEGGG